MQFKRNNAVLELPLLVQIIYLFSFRLTSLMMVWDFLCVFGAQLTESPFCIMKDNNGILG